MKLSRETVQVALESVKMERYQLIERIRSRKCQPSDVQAEMNVLNEARLELTKALYPVVTARQVAYKVNSDGFEATVYYDTTQYERWTDVKLLTADKQDLVSVTYNNDQHIAYSADREYFVQHMKGNQLSLTPVDHYHNVL